MINGSAHGNRAGLFKSGAHAEIDAGNLKIGRGRHPGLEFNAQRESEQAMTALGVGNIGGVDAANNGTADGAIAAMVEAGVDPLPPVIGQDAEVAGLQRILTGSQLMTAWRRYARRLSAGLDKWRSFVGSGFFSTAWSYRSVRARRETRTLG